MFCPNLVCPARGRYGQGNIGVHSRKEQRYTCPICKRTFAPSKGTVFFRLRTAADVASLTIILLRMMIMEKGAERKRENPSISPRIAIHSR